MKVAVIGLWHLGCVYSASLASLGHQVLAIDEDLARVNDLTRNVLPLEETGLADLMLTGVASGNLTFSSDFDLIKTADVAWITIDTPVRDDDSADVNAVFEIIDRVLLHLRNKALLVISSQLPLGSTSRIEKRFAELRPDRHVDFAYSPENLRLGTAISSFMEADRIVIGTSSQQAESTLSKLLAPLDIPIVSMSVESAELSKHALNSFLAMSVAFANEIARVAEHHGANAWDVAAALKSDRRIGPRAYVTPGGPIAGGTLARDIRYLETLAHEDQVRIPVIEAVLESHNEQKLWPIRALVQTKGPKDGPILVLGLAYKSGSSTLRRSFGLEVALQAKELGYDVRILDNSAEALPSGFEGLTRFADVNTALVDTSAVIICANESTVTTLPGLLQGIKEPPCLIDVIGAFNSSSQLLTEITVLCPGKARRDN